MSSKSRTWLGSASNARASMKFILVMLAVLAPIVILVIELNSTATQNEAAGVGSKGKILIAGGNGADNFASASTELYDPATNTFAPGNETAVMNTDRSAATAIALSSGPNVGKILVVGGINFNGALSSTELYDPASNSFAPSSQTASMNTARSTMTATVITVGPNAGKILITGGSQGALASTELYDPLTNSFAPAAQTATMNFARFGETATLITTGPNAGKILVAGGFGSGGILASTELYDPLTNSFAPADQTASMNVSRQSATATVLTTGPNVGKILIAGGQAAAVGSTASTELYDPATNSFAPPGQTASMNVARDRATATLLMTGPQAGKILIAGGIDNSTYLASTELYDPVTNTFAPANETAVMNDSRMWGTATTLMTGPNAGKILIVGGLGVNGVGGGNGALASTELYDPIANRFAPASQTASMNSSRYQQAAAQIPQPTPIFFVGSGALADTSSPVTTLAISLPLGVQSGDVLVTQFIVYDGTGTNVPLAPPGWSAIRHDAVNNAGTKMTSWLYFKVAGTNEPAFYSWNIASQYAAGVMGAWRGASLVTPIDQSSGANASGASPILAEAPSLTPAGNQELQVYFYGSQSRIAPIIGEPSAITQRSNTISTKEGFSLAIGDLFAPPAGTASPVYVATSTLTGNTLVMTAQAVLLVPLNAVATPTPTVQSQTPTPIMTIGPTIIPTGGATLNPTPATPLPTPGTTVPHFIAAGALTDSAQPLKTVTVSLPPNVMSGDLLIAQIAVWDASGTDLPVAPAGWSPIRDDSIGSTNKITSWLYYHVAGGSEPASYSWTLVSQQYAAGLMGAWRSASSSSPIDQSSGSVASGPSPVSDAAPSLTPAGNNELQVYFYGSQGNVAPAITEPGAITSRANLKSSKEGFTLAFGDLAAPVQGVASPTYAATSSLASGNPAMTAQAILLRPGP